MSVSKDRPLTPVQERALIAYGHRDDREPGVMTRLTAHDVSVVTAEKLERLGLLEVSWSGQRGRHTARITDAGRAMLNSMGD